MWPNSDIEAWRVSPVVNGKSLLSFCQACKELGLYKKPTEWPLKLVPQHRAVWPCLLKHPLCFPLASCPGQLPKSFP
uniref:Uncharacterized protein n=1 Tax=Rhinopithecus roxellana TaxID=61622 RepID=A0A2K6QFW2_RHIRO